MMYRLAKLHDELIASGLMIRSIRAVGETVGGLAAAVDIDWIDTPTSEQRALAEQILAAHDPVDYDALVQAGAEQQAAAIPSWASWTEEQALSWHDTNIKTPLDAATTLAQAKAVLLKMEAENRALLRMIIALRNHTWPGLQR